MSRPIRTLGVANGGGDAPGLNAVIRGVVKTAIQDHGWRVIGVTSGFDGLIWPERCRELDFDAVRGILPQGGTILGTTNRGNPFAYTVEEDGKTVTQDFSPRCLENFRQMGLDALVVIGGDGTLAIARDFYKLGMPVVGVPKTIDNDLDATEFTFGFDTALGVATDAVDRLHTTAASHNRVMVLEVMGRDAGWIALHAGIAGGADVILIPEIPFTLSGICAKLERRVRRGRLFSIVVIAEGVTLPEGFPGAPSKPGLVGQAVAQAISQRTGVETRTTVLGHIQRGGSPTPFDRILGTRFGAAAVDLAAAGRFGRMVCLGDGRIGSVTLEQAVGTYKRVDPACDYVRAARGVGISFGEESG